MMGILLISKGAFVNKLSYYISMFFSSRPVYIRPIFPVSHFKQNFSRTFSI